jgi:hypothetical protein
MILDTSQLKNRGLIVGLLRTTGDMEIIIGPLLEGSLLDVGCIVSIFLRHRRHYLFFRNRLMN